MFSVVILSYMQVRAKTSFANGIWSPAIPLSKWSHVCIPYNTGVQLLTVYIYLHRLLFYPLYLKQVENNTESIT